MEKIKLFQQFNPDITPIGVVHDMNIAATFADSVMLLKDKRIYKFDTPKKVLTEENLQHIFNIVVKNYFVYKT